MKFRLLFGLALTLSFLTAGMLLNTRSARGVSNYVDGETPPHAVYTDGSKVPSQRVNRQADHLSRTVTIQNGASANLKLLSITPSTTLTETRDGREELQRVCLLSSHRSAIGVGRRTLF
jgi:hypothetical protein